MVDELEFKLYHCPAMEFQLGHIDGLEASAMGWYKPRAYVPRLGIINFPYGASKGSSGGVIVNRDGKAVAMHLSSTNQVLTLDEINSDTSHNGKDATSVALDSAADNHCSIATCIILSHFPDLLIAIR
jgi:hypothetical protein